MRITWLGHSAFLIDEKILIDPWITNPAFNGKPEDFKDVKLILLTHGHGDHVGDLKEIYEISKPEVACIYELGILLKEEGIKTRKLNVGGSFEFEDYWIKVLPAIHSSSYKGKYAGCPCGFLIETPEGQVIYHAGDTYLFEGMKEIKCDIAILPIGGTYTMDPLDALKAVLKIKPRIVIPMHYGTFPEIEVDEKWFEERCYEMGYDCITLSPGETFTEEIEYGEEE